MKILLQINSVVNTGSTGRIAEEIGQTTIAYGWNSYIAYGRKAQFSQSNLVKIGNDYDIILHGLQSRLFDRHGLASRSATENLVRQIQEIKPDVIHLHNLHGYYINYSVLFSYLKASDIPIVWTLHDCWPITGHCAYFSWIGCEKWKTACQQCPQKRAYPTSLAIDCSFFNFNFKKDVFNSIDNLILVPVSKWLEEICRQSFLRNLSIRVIYNGVDQIVFKPSPYSLRLREKYSIGNSFLILGVASNWTPRKGLDDFIRLSKYKTWTVVLVGIPEKLKKRIPSNIIALSKIENQQELSSLYSAADVFLNPTYEDNFPTVNIEALACGTPVITYNTGGSPEAIDEHTGLVVEKGDIEGLIAAIQQIKEKGKDFYTETCVARARKLFKKEERYREYVELYETIAGNNKAKS